jgi:hypothetical protein
MIDLMISQTLEQSNPLQFPNSELRIRVTFQLLERLTIDAPRFHNIGAADRGTCHVGVNLRCLVGQPIGGSLSALGTKN